MANTLYIPYLNPVHLYDKDAENLPQYFHKHFENYSFEDTQQQPWAQKTHYFQKWQKNDIIKFQFESNFSAISIEVLDCKGSVKATVNALQLRANKYISGFYVYEASISLVSLTSGRHRLRIILGDQTFLSEWMDVQDVWPNTVLLEYRNSRHHMDVFFETGITFNLRVEGTIGRMEPGSDDTVYEDQPRNPHLLSSKPYRTFELSMGGSRGVPDWMVDKINFIWTCNTVFVDGKSFAKSGDTKLELRSEKNYPMRSIVMKLREGINRGSKIIEPNLNANIKLAVVNPVDGIVFGDVALGAASNVIIIQGIE
jgi:hypothetical protein